MGHFVFYNQLRQTFHERTLSHTGFTDQYGIILFAARQNLRHAFDFIVASNNRIQHPLSGSLSQVYPIIVKNGSIFSRSLISRRIISATAALTRITSCRHRFVPTRHIRSYGSTTGNIAVIFGDELHRAIIIEVERREHFASVVGFISQHGQEQMYVRGIIFSLQTRFKLCQSQNAIDISRHLCIFCGGAFIGRRFNLCLQRVAQLFCGNAKLFDHF